MSEWCERTSERTSEGPSASIPISRGSESLCLVHYFSERLTSSHPRRRHPILSPCFASLQLLCNGRGACVSLRIAWRKSSDVPKQDLNSFRKESQFVTKKPLQGKRFGSCQRVLTKWRCYSRVACHNFMKSFILKFKIFETEQSISRVSQFFVK